MHDDATVISGGLLRLLADTFTLLFKTRHLSWRVNGQVASGLRAIVRQDHRDIDEAADKIARRIIALGRQIPPSYGALIRSSSIDQEFQQRSEMAMLEQISEDHAQILADIETLETILPLAEDKETVDLLQRLATCHESCRRSLATMIKPDDVPIQ